MRTNLSTLALLGLLALVACKREEIETVPEDTSGTKEVTTQFVLNVTAAPSTRMSADVAQQNQNFRGIQDARLFTYKTGWKTTDTFTPYVLNPSAASEKDYDLGLLFAGSSLDNTSYPDEEDKTVIHYRNDEESSRRVLQLSVPVGVDAVLFYGKAIKNSGAEDKDYGSTTASISATPANTVFKAKKILNESNDSSYVHTANLMISVINDILAIKVPEQTYTDGTTGQEVTLPELTWAQYGHQYEYDQLGDNGRYPASLGIGHKATGLEEVLGRCYYMFTYIIPSDIDEDIEVGSPDWYDALDTAVRPQGEYRAGSSHSIKTMIIDMFKVINAAASAITTSPNEQHAYNLAVLIIDRAALYFQTADAAEGEGTWKKGDYKTVTAIKQLLIGYDIVSATKWNTSYKKAEGHDLNNFPNEFGVPEGAAQLGFHYQGESSGGTTYTKDEFYYYHPNRPLVNPAIYSFDPKKYLYPAELWYYVNSPIRTTTSDVSISNYPNGVSPWNKDSNWSTWDTPGKVSGDTRGVAVKENINYGVALLKTVIDYYPGEWVYFEDNRRALTNGVEDNKKINRSAAQLELRGILVGGMNPRMNWQFTRKYTSSGNHEGLGDLSLFDGVIYDHSLSHKNVPSDGPNYTLVYDNYNSSGTGGQSDQNDVYICLEFVNRGESFYGRDNVIPSGGVFYLAAKLDKPSTEVIDAWNAKHKWPEDHQIPPVYGVGADAAALTELGENAGKSMQIFRVFIQDFVTTATFRLRQNSLQNAYYSVPDLRASQMSLGLSVDLQWTPGLDYVLDL